MRAGVMCVVMLSGERSAGEEDGHHTGETLYNVRTNLRWERGSRMTNLMGGHQTLSSSGDARHLFQENNQQYQLSSDILLSAPLPPSINFRVARCLIVSCKIKAISSKHLSRYYTCCLAWRLTCLESVCHGVGGRAMSLC